ncbi:M1 family peptidase [Parashewanella spongiae]|uniref:M1 family peptidase n=1 Tax=Parashewanella spongiae TaxID=342950 RepID=A0A3A6TF51_9GAMM|nr:M1 family metallopeptidase [Parashewanella spongiae]MCL1079875.1 M1 family metallopeptidase [Parashewanella spongiae]RJY06658.1 M1 family peptidase [Parashewanella spongiae]
MTLNLVTVHANASIIEQTKGNFQDKFRQLEEHLPTPNDYRNAAGEPGKDYWQQQVDYKIDVRLDEKKRRLSGSEIITYHNNSPYTLKYLWFQLEQNRFKTDSAAERTSVFKGINNNVDAHNTHEAKAFAKIGLKQLRRQQFMTDNELGYVLSSVTDKKGKPLKYTIVGAQMRVDLPMPLKPNHSTKLNIEYGYNILEEDAVGARSGYEHFPDDVREGGNDIYLLAQWFPRVASYSDYEAWHNKEFLGSGEFTLEFGNYDVKMTVPSDHIVTATGTLQNPNKVLTGEQQKRLKKAETAKKPLFIVTPEEALNNESSVINDEKTWHFKAENVRDFAWASSRKFIWDAQGYQQGGDINPHVMAMSFYPKEGGELWEKYSTASAIHTMEVYSRFTFDYPYPTAISVNGPVGGMEYPMISFNGPRTIWHDDGSRTYTLSEKQFLIGVVIHEVGHNYFPMIVNSDERQWGWMDEGLNSFLDGISTREWDSSLDWGREPEDIIDYMKSNVQVPIMTQADSVLRLGPNAYIKPAVALNILREVVLGRELFDFAFREYSQRWMNKRPTPSDFFRTMEEASGVDLDWFFKGWFYTTDHVDISLDSIYKLRLDTSDPDIDYERRRQSYQDKPMPLAVKHNQRDEYQEWVKMNSDIRDYHDENDRFSVTNKERNKYQSKLAGLEPWERKVLDRALEEDKNYYVFDFSNLGGLVMPILLELTFENGETESLMIPAEIWRRSPKQVNKLIVTDKDKVLVSAVIDRGRETADVDIENNYYPRQIIQSRIEAFKSKKRKGNKHRDIMHDNKQELKTPDVKVKKK